MEQDFVGTKRWIRQASPYETYMAHFAGLVAGGAHPSPFPHAHERRRQGRRHRRHHVGPDCTCVISRIRTPSSALPID